MSGYCIYEVFELPEPPKLSQLETKTKISLKESVRDMMVFMPEGEKDFTELKNATFLFKFKSNHYSTFYQSISCGPQVLRKHNYVQFVSKTFLDDPTKLFLSSSNRRFGAPHQKGLPGRDAALASQPEPLRLLRAGRHQRQ